ncbi:MAG: aminotransferase class V-fold PLP-dependent enzyme, partial [Clostridia bacterium]|nr:aminotransferase class V-fold PLP-dependent enzyme [Clostridia bacterium]
MIYLDNSATTKPCEAALHAAHIMQTEMWHNPSSPYRQAVCVEKKIAACRDTIAGMLKAPPAGVLFTAGGTEADSLAILGSAARFRGPSRVLLFQAEHSAVRTTAAELEHMGHSVSFIPATDCGLIDLEALSAELSPDVRLVSCMHVGNETGAVQPLAEIARIMQNKCPDAVFHVDGAQGFLRTPVDMPGIGIDLYAFSAHKIHGMKGAG